MAVFWHSPIMGRTWWHSALILTGALSLITGTILPPTGTWIQRKPFVYIRVADFRRPGRTLMSKSNLEDGVADAIAATALISVALVALMIWLSGLPS